MSTSFADRIMSSWVSQNEVLKPDNNIFTQPRTEGELDLVSACRAAMVGAGLINSVTEAFDTHQYIKDAALLGEVAQRFLLNKFWHVQLLSLDCDTQKERFCLLDQGEAKEWMRCFVEGVLPKIVEYRLPVVI